MKAHSFILEKDRHFVKNEFPKVPGSWRHGSLPRAAIGVRRAKLYYLRGLRGKAARIQENHRSTAV
ncbi:hypothetical protein CF651_26385 [Paenibacillus rigui]|uniref:Large ribosomal subunit protein bL19 n=1 Tax=Paenibacillus rigui TaxID=554312 RepID=A0A229UIS4_9BACL|nr:hypothetical protein CF651_26385 [Paenibacillus rigui]